MQLLKNPPSMLDAAYKLAITSPYGRFRLGAIYARKNQIISMGVNQRRTHPLQKKYTCKPHLAPFLHAEIHGIALAKDALEGCDVYVARSLMDGSRGHSRPCAGCMKALQDYGVRRMYYYGNDGKYYKEDVVR